MRIRPHGIGATALAAVLLLVVAEGAFAAPWNFVGARQQAMGGAGVATTQDSTANYWNPANLAFQKGWGVSLPVTIEGNIENDALDKLSNLLVSYDELGAAGDQIFECAPACLPTALTPALRDQIARFLRDFALYGKAGENVHVNASLGLAGRYENFGFSALSLSTGTVFPNTDLDNLAVGPNALDAIVGGGPYRTPANTSLATQLVAASGGYLDAAQAGELVFLFEQAGANTTDQRLQTLLRGLVSQAANAGVFSANDTGALLAGLSSQEFGISFATKLPVPYVKRTRGRTRQILNMVHNKVAISVVPKYILGVTYLKFFRYDEDESAGGIVTSLVNIDQTNVSHAFGLDIALAYRPTSWLRFGMMARNVNSPSFDVTPFVTPSGRYVTSVTTDAQVRMGMAMIPMRNLTIAFDFDATSNEMETLPGFESRYVSLGAEYVIPVGRHVGVALRLGGYNNVSSTVEQDWAMTGGLGLRLGSFHMDLSAGGSFAKETIRTGSTSFDTFPTRLNAGLSLSWEKSL